MGKKVLDSYTIEDVPGLFRDYVDAVIIVDSELYQYKSIIRRDIFTEVVDETGSYEDLIEKLWFHFGDNNEKITDDYRVFISTFGDFKDKYSRRIKIFLDGSDQPHIVQLTVYPLGDSGQYMFVMDELDNNEYVQENMTSSKVATIQNTYLFSMYIDLVRDTTSSISITEVSDETVNSNLKYTEWRQMIVNMFWPEDQEQFLRRSDPEYLKQNFTPGRTASYDCMMMNMEGKYIWVKLIFSRAETKNEDDFRFVFMVQNIHENSVELLSTLKKYEQLALTDPLTSLLNHGGIETEMYNAIDLHKKKGEAVSFMMLDIDHFKDVNDKYGHAVGDNTLKFFANILTESIEDEKAPIGRWGGEEFVIVCLGKDGKAANDLAEKIRKRVEDSDFPEIGKVTCSIGVSEIKDDDDFDVLFNRMDKAMYSSKENGRNRVTLI